MPPSCDTDTNHDCPELTGLGEPAAEPAVLVAALVVGAALVVVLAEAGAVAVAVVVLAEAAAAVAVVLVGVVATPAVAAAAARRVRTWRAFTAVR